MTYQLIHGDCLEVLPTLEAQSVDAIIADIPYGTTACSWDTVIPFEPMWEVIKHVIKPRGAVVLFGSQPFTSALVMSNVKWFKYEWVWDKVNRFTNYGNIKYMPLTAHENLCVFSSGSHTFNPQILSGKPYKAKRTGNIATVYQNGGLHPQNSVNNGFRLPTTILKQRADNKRENGLHPTQKPVALMSYLVKTYTNPGDTVLDFTCGSGSTGVAAVQNGRHFIGIDNGHCEKEGPYYGWRWVDVARERIVNAAGEFVQTEKEKQTGQMALWDVSK